MTKKLKLEEMNGPEYRKHLMQQSYELRQAAIKSSGDPQATLEHAPEAARAKATEVMSGEKVVLADERRVSAPTIGNVADAVPKSSTPQSTADLNPPKVKETTVSDDKAKQ